MGLFNKKKTNTKHIEYHFTREDGSTFILSPVLNENGFQDYEEFPNKIKIPKFDFFTRSYIPGKLFGTELLIDVNPELLGQEDYQSIIANLLLPKSRMKKILSEYCKYAGGFTYDPNSKIASKYVDQQIIKTLQERKRIKEAAQEASKVAEFGETLLASVDPTHHKASRTQASSSESHRRFYDDEGR